MHPSEYPAGTRIGSSVVLPDGDYETYSEAGYAWNAAANKWDALPGAPSGQNRYGLGCVGAAVYTEHPSAEVICFAYNLKDGAGARFWRPGMRNPEDLFQHVARGGLFEAWNVAFERWVWLNICTPKYGWPTPPPIWQFRCAMAKARHYGLPGGLGNAGTVLGLQIQKDKEGGRLIKLFTTPRQPTKKDPRTRITVDEDPIDGPKFLQYNYTDILSEAEASAMIPDLEGEELEFWMCDFAMNARGIHVDLPSVDACISIIAQGEEKYNAELKHVTAGVVEKATELPTLKAWLRQFGLHVDTLDEDALAAHFKLWLPPVARRALEIRAAIGSAAVKKVYAMRLRATAAHRLHDNSAYHGAHTGRITGSGVQMTNMRTEGPPVRKCGCGRYFGARLIRCPWCNEVRWANLKIADWCIEAAEDALSVIATRSLEALEYYFCDAFATIAGCLRALLTAGESHDLIASDYHSIEAVVLAAIANEGWRLEVFHTHGKIYEMGASKITGIPFEEYMRYRGYDMSKPEWWRQEVTGKHHPTRQTVGKISELASGYGGWIGAWERFGALDAGLTLETIKSSLLAWRKASPGIVELWGGQFREVNGSGWSDLVPELYGCEGMAIASVQNPGVEYHVKRLDGTRAGVSYYTGDNILWLTIPSGRRIPYHRPQLEPSTRYKTTWALSYEGWNTNPVKGPQAWIRMYVYGGLWVENICQATARDVLRYGIINLERAGYPVVLQVYDEIIAEVRQGCGSLEEFERIMSTMPPWAANWPIHASGGWRGLRYRKG